MRREGSRARDSAPARDRRIECYARVFSITNGERVFAPL